MSEPTPLELADDILAREQDRPYQDRGEDPVWRWERWIQEEPERAWMVFEELVQRAPNDVEVLERIAQRLKLLLSNRWEDFHEKVDELVKQSTLLSLIVEPRVLSYSYYLPRYRSVDELAIAWLAYDSVADAVSAIEDILRSDRNLGIRLALEIIDRGPLNDFGDFDVGGPLLLLLGFHGPSVIEDIERAALESEALRRVIWSSRTLDPFVRDRWNQQLWERFVGAAGETTLYNSVRPPGRRSVLGQEYDDLVDQWFVAEGAFWAWEELGELVTDEPTKAWETIQAIARHTNSEDALGTLGAGALEDLICSDPQTFLEPIEILARTNENFRRALAGVWLRLDDIPENLARRYFAASGGELEVLDAPPDWKKDVGAV